jgi:hypothetical protein
MLDALPATMSATERAIAGPRKIPFRPLPDAMKTPALLGAGPITGNPSGATGRKQAV